MKKSIVILSLILIILFSAYAKGASEITVYAYDSFTSDWGPGADLVKQFEEKTGHKVNLVGFPGAAEMLSQVEFEGRNCEADVVIGISDMMKCDESLFYKWTPSCAGSLEGLRKDSALIPFDYGVFAFIFNTRANMVKPASLSNLTGKAYKDQVILIDPRTSSAGLGALLWSISAFGEEGAFSWWSQMAENALTVSPTWSQAYGLFTEGEAPLVLSYTTSPVYHVMYEDTTDFRALEFAEGHIMTTEYLGILKTSKNKAVSEEFCNFLLTEGQSRIATDNTMFPANRDTVLPESFEYALMPSVILNEGVKTDTDKIDYYLDLWTKAVIR